MARVRPPGIPKTVSMPACSRTRTIASGTLTVSVRRRSVVISSPWYRRCANVCAGAAPLPLLSFQLVSVERRLESHGDRPAQALGRMAGALGVRGQLAHLLRACRADDVQLDGHLLEVGWRVVDVVLLSVAEGGADVGGGILDRDLVEGREPRQLGEQSKRGADHQVLKRRCTLLRAAASERLIGLDCELAHAALEVN